MKAFFTLAVVLVPVFTTPAQAITCDGFNYPKWEDRYSFLPHKMLESLDNISPVDDIVGFRVCPSAL